MIRAILYIALSVFLNSSIAFAYDIDFGDDSKSDNKDSKVYDFFNKSFSGGISHTQQFSNDDNERSYSAVNLRFDRQFDNLRVVADGLFEKVNIKIAQNIQGDSGGQVVFEDRRVIEYSRDKFRPNDIFLSYDLGEVATVSAGLKRFTFGQFEPFSPTNFALPSNITTTGTSFSKLNSAIAQEFASLEVFPTSWISLQYIYMPSIKVDDLLEKNINQGRTEFVDDGNGGFNSVQTGLKDPDWQNRDQHAIRLMMYPDWGTLGFTVFEGYRTWFEDDFRNIDSTNIGGANTFYVSSVPGLARQKMVSFEATIPVKKFNFKLELARFFDATYSINDYDSSIIDSALKNQPDPGNYEGDYQAGSEFFRRIRDEYNGNFFFESDYNVAAIGFDADLTKWYIDFAIFAYQQDFSDDQRRLLDLKNQAFSHFEIEDDEGGVFPMLNIARYTDRLKTGKVGVIAGIIGNGQGAAIYYNKEYKESISLGVALAVIEYFSDGAIEDDFERREDEARGVRYQKTEDFSNSLIVSLGYKF